MGRATPRPPVDPWSTAEQQVVQTETQPSIVYVEVPRRRGGALLVVVLLIVALLLGGAAGLLLNPGLRTAIGMGPQSPSTPSPSPSPEPAPPPGIGDPVRDDDFEFMVTDVDCGHKQVGDAPFKVKAKGQYCLVGISVRNVGKFGSLLQDSAQYAYTGDGRRHSTDSGAGVLANRGITVWLNLIQPNATVTGILVFDIPDEATIERIELHDSAGSDGAVITV